MPTGELADRLQPADLLLPRGLQRWDFLAETAVSKHHHGFHSTLPLADSVLPSACLRNDTRTMKFADTKGAHEFL